MNLATQRRVSVIALAVTAALLSACSSSSNSDDETSTPRAETTKPGTTNTPSPTPVETPAPVAPAPEDLSFEAGTVLGEGDWDMGWGDSMGSDPGFSVLAPDEGEGSYAYTDVATQCKIYFYQGSITDLDMTQDDRTISDDFLATMLSQTVEGSTREDVAAHAFDDMVLQHPGPGTAATRTIWGNAQDGSTWLHSSRMFGALSAGVYVGITCPAGEQDASMELRKLVEDYLRLIVSPMA